MNKSYSKIRHIQESNMILEKRKLTEQQQTTSVTMQGGPKGRNTDAQIKNEIKKWENGFVNKEITKLLNNFVMVEPGGQYGEYGGGYLKTTYGNEPSTVTFTCNGKNTVGETPKYYPKPKGMEARGYAGWFPQIVGDPEKSDNGRMKGLAAAWCAILNGQTKD